MKKLGIATTRPYSRVSSSAASAAAAAAAAAQMANQNSVVGLSNFAASTAALVSSIESSSVDDGLIQVGIINLI